MSPEEEVELLNRAGWRRPRALDLFCRAGGVSEGLRRAGFDVVGVDILDCSKAYNKGPGSLEHENPARFVQADALKVMDGLISGWAGNELAKEAWGSFDLICASPPCQAHSVLRHLVKDKEYPDLIPQTRERLKASGIPYCIENVPGAPLEGSLLVLCGTMFGLGTPDGRAELRRHRHFETSFPVTFRPECRHGVETLTVTGHGVQTDGMIQRRRAQGELRRSVSVTGSTPQTNVERNVLRETFSTDDARHAMGISWMAMKDLSQAIPPCYSHFIGLMFLGEDPTHLLAEGGCMHSLF